MTLELWSRTVRVPRISQTRQKPNSHKTIRRHPTHTRVRRALEDNVYVYWKNGTERMERPGIQGGGLPKKIGPHAQVEPYGHASDLYQADEKFADYFTACMGMFMQRFEGIRPNFKERPNGGIGAFTPDNIPIIDWVLPNVYMVADSNHGFKMTGIGKLVARELAGSQHVEGLAPFRFNRFANGTAYGSGVTHSPWV